VGRAGLVGLFNVVMLWPFGFLLNYTGIESFALPSVEIHRPM
jgi:glycopeptide antibiotics resistance protein